MDGILARLTDTPLKPEDTHRLVEQLLDEQTIGLFKKKGSRLLSQFPGIRPFPRKCFSPEGNHEHGDQGDQYGSAEDNTPWGFPI